MNVNKKDLQNHRLLLQNSSIHCWIVIMYQTLNQIAKHNKVFNESLNWCSNFNNFNIKYIKMYNNNISRFKFVLLHNITYQSIDHISVYVEFFDVLLNEYQIDEFHN